MNQQLQNLRDLLVIGERILEKKLPFHFGAWTFQKLDHCGTFGCLLGQYGLSKGVAVCNTMDAPDRGGRLPPFSWAMDEFGITMPYAVALFRSGEDAKCPGADMFGETAYAELGRRLVHLRAMIAEREAAEKPATDAIPESVRAIFAELNSVSA